MLEKEIENIKSLLMEMYELTEESLKILMMYDLNQDEKVKKVIENERKINELQLEIDRDCLKVLSLWELEATPLRKIVAFMRINDEIERIGDLIMNLLKDINLLTENPEATKKFKETKLLKLMKEMYEKVLKYYQEVMKAFLEENPKKAKEYFWKDQEIDKMRRETFNEITEELQSGIINSFIVFPAIMIFSNLEKIGDRINNISKNIVFMVSGEYIGHRGTISEGSNST